MPRTALVTGGTRGIGLAVARRLRRDGLTVAVLAAHPAGEIIEGMCAAAVTTVEKRLGPIEVLVNNAGMVADATLHKMTPAQWRAVISVDLDSMFNMCRQVIGGMRDRGFGRIVNIASINGQKGQFGQANYSAAKAGVVGFTKALAQEGARKGVTVNAIAPGYVATDMLSGLSGEVLDGIVADIPVGRLGTPEDVARCVSFLAAEDAGFITGAVLAVNGGQYMIG